jgi:hypothetical protein
LKTNEAGKRDVCPDKKLLMARYRVAMVRYSAALADLSFELSGLTSAAAASRWKDLEAARVEADRLRRDFINHMDGHGC